MGITVNEVNEGKRLLFEVEVHDEVDLISQGKHERAVIIKEKFDVKMKEKANNMTERGDR